jgi:uncharacterized membrane protein
MRTQSEHCVAAPSEGSENFSREWVLRRNCSASPRQLAAAYGFLCSGSLAVAIFFALQGALYVLGFAVLELAAVGCAFFVFARHASDRDHLALNGRVLQVDLVRKERVQRFRFHVLMVRIGLDRKAASFIVIECHGEKVEVGGFLTERKRRETVRELREALAAVG